MLYSMYPSSLHRLSHRIRWLHHLGQRLHTMGLSLSSYPLGWRKREAITHFRDTGIEEFAYLQRQHAGKEQSEVAPFERR